MATEEDLEKKPKDEDEAEDALAEPKAEVRPKADSEPAEGEVAPQNEAAPMQLGYVRFVYAAYMGGAMITAFLVAKIGHLAWYRLGQWKPDQVGEPNDVLVYLFAGLL